MALSEVCKHLAMSKRRGGRFVGYRNSKLTYLLRNSFGGNSRTAIIVNVSPSDLCEKETLSSLRFGDRAASIRNKPTVQRSTDYGEEAGGVVVGWAD
jgi:hypothetical protein